MQSHEHGSRSCDTNPDHRVGAEDVERGFSRCSMCEPRVPGRPPRPPAGTAPDPPCRLVLLEDGGDPRYFLDGRPVHNGDLLQVLVGFDPSPCWSVVRFEWSHRFGTRPSFIFMVPDRFDSINYNPLSARMTLPEQALFRRYTP